MSSTLGVVVLTPASVHRNLISGFRLIPHLICVHHKLHQRRLATTNNISVTKIHLSPCILFSKFRGPVGWLIVNYVSSPFKCSWCLLKKLFPTRLIFLTLLFVQKKYGILFKLTARPTLITLSTLQLTTS